MHQVGRPVGRHRPESSRERLAFATSVAFAGYYQTPTLERLKLLSIVNRTAEPPRSEIACDK